LFLIDTEKDKMTDIFTSEKRSEIMSNIRSGDTKPEKIVRSLLHRMGYRFRLHRNKLPGCPDIVFPKRKKVIFVHGCFWHGHANCSRSTLPKTRIDYWRNKISKTMSRDIQNNRALIYLGWQVLIIWQCETKDLSNLEERLNSFLDI